MCATKYQHNMKNATNTEDATMGTQPRGSNMWALACFHTLALQACCRELATYQVLICSDICAVNTLSRSLVDYFHSTVAMQPPAPLHVLVQPSGPSNLISLCALAIFR